MSIISGASIVEFKNFLNEYEEKGIIVSKFRTYIKEFINKNKEKKQKKTRNPSDYNKFVKECMLNDDDIKKEGLTQGEKMKICAKKWEDYKNDNPGLFEKREFNKDNQKKTNVLPKKIKIKLDFPVDSDDNSDEKKVDEKKVDEKKKDEKKIKKEEEKKIKKEAKEAEKKAKKEAKEAEKKAKKEAKKNTKKEDKKVDSSDDEYDFDANVDSYLNDE